jgi:hypothetical protein
LAAPKHGEIALALVNEVRGFAAEAIWRRMIRYTGCLRSSRLLTQRLKVSFADRYAYEERAEIALTVAGMYPGGDYFEFGSASFRTFRNFLTAFDLNGLPAKLPETRFVAFDVFGDLDAGDGTPAADAWYFKNYRGDRSYQAAEEQLRRHGLLLDRCELVKGYFEDTLNDALKSRLQQERRAVGFAFLDCNISQSYRTCFGFLQDVMRTDRCFVYMDEYFLTLDVPSMFDAFCAVMRDRHNMRAHYVRNAGAFGALYCLMREPMHEPL